MCVSSQQVELKPDGRSLKVMSLTRAVTAFRRRTGMSVRAWSGLRHCQQNRAAGVSRARRRVWMPVRIVASRSRLPRDPPWRRAGRACGAAASRRARPARRRAARARAGSAPSFPAPSPA